MDVSASCRHEGIRIHATFFWRYSMLRRLVPVVLCALGVIVAACAGSGGGSGSGSGSDSKTATTVSAKQPCVFVIKNSKGAVISSVTDTARATEPCTMVAYAAYDSVVPDTTRGFRHMMLQTRVDSVGIDGILGSMTTFSAGGPAGAKAPSKK